MTSHGAKGRLSTSSLGVGLPSFRGAEGWLGLLIAFILISQVVIVHSSVDLFNTTGDDSSTTEDMNMTTIEDTTTLPTTTEETTTTGTTTTQTSIVIKEPGKDTIRKTSWIYAFYDEGCVTSNSSATGGRKICDPNSHLECKESLRHSLDLICHCEPGCVVNPYDINRCIPKQNYKRQFGETCEVQDDEKCDINRFLWCNKKKHCECVEDPYIITLTDKTGKKYCDTKYDRYEGENGARRCHSLIITGYAVFVGQLVKHKILRNI